MKKIILIGFMAGLLALMLAGCIEETPKNSCGPVPPSGSSQASSEDSGSESASSEPDSSQTTSSEVSSTASSSKAASSQSVSSRDEKVAPNTPVSPPPDTRTQEEIDKELAEWEAEEAEIEKLMKLPAEFTAEIGQEVYPIGVDNVIIKVENKGPGALSLFEEIHVEMLVNDEWISSQAFIPPQTVAIIQYVKPGESIDYKYSLKRYNLVEAGKYRISQSIGNDVAYEDYWFEFNLE